MYTELQTDFGTPAEQLNILANLLELALYAPDDEVTFAGKLALQSAARQVSVLSAELSAGTTLNDLMPSVGDVKKR